MAKRFGQMQGTLYKDKLAKTTLYKGAAGMPSDVASIAQEATDPPKNTLWASVGTGMG